MLHSMILFVAASTLTTDLWAQSAQSDTCRFASQDGRTTLRVDRRDSSYNYFEDRSGGNSIRGFGGTGKFKVVEGVLILSGELKRQTLRFKMTDAADGSTNDILRASRLRRKGMHRAVLTTGP